MDIILQRERKINSFAEKFTNKPGNISMKRARRYTTIQLDIIHTDDCLKILKTLPDDSVHRCVISPPYYALRDYGMEAQIGRETTPKEYKEHSKTERVESTRRRYGEFQNVFLSDEECSQLETAYPGKAAEYIERLSRYMASNDRHYANHYATIKKWLDEDSKGRSAKNYTYDDNEGECL